jgi:hypothetical protein
MAADSILSVRSPRDQYRRYSYALAAIGFLLLGLPVLSGWRGRAQAARCRSPAC